MYFIVKCSPIEREQKTRKLLKEKEKVSAIYSINITGSPDSHW